MFEPAKIPGMIEPGEQQLLSELAADPFVGENGIIVEFGCFFGRSTSCLVNGALQWWQAGSAPAVHAFDSFACDEAASFAPHVFAFANPSGAAKLVRRQGGRIDFYPVYRHFVGAAEDQGVLKTTVTEMRDATYAGGPIALMHLDAPKFYEELKYILFRFFPSLAPGAAVVFQDYLYHWSATVIAAAQVLVEAGVLRFERSVATSAVARVLRTPTPTELLEIDLTVARTPVVELIDRSLKMIGQMQVDRPEQFIPRVHLAKVQYLWEQGEFAAAQAAFAQMIQASEGKLRTPVFNDFQELMRHGFSIRRLYEIDHA